MAAILLKTKLLLALKKTREAFDHLSSYEFGEKANVLEECELPKKDLKKSPEDSLPKRSMSLRTKNEKASSEDIKNILLKIGKKPREPEVV